MFSVFVLLMIAVPARADSTGNPIQKIIELITEFQGKIIKDGEVEQKAYEEYFEWCDDMSKSLSFDIKSATAKRAKLEATIAKCASQIESGDSTIEELAASISEGTEGLSKATAIRKKEKAD